MSRLAVLCYNTHVGLNLPRLRRLIRGLRVKPDLVLLQECNSPAARGAARLMFPPPLWSCAGNQPASKGRHSSGTLVFARRSRFKKVGWTNKQVSAARPGDRFHPERRLTLGHYVDRETGREVDVSSMHPWHTKGALPGGPVMAGHQAQVEGYAELAKAATDAGRVAIFGGDTNEHVDRRASSPIEKALWVAGLEPARPEGDHTERLDEVFVDRQGTRVLMYARHVIPGGEPEHQAIVVHCIIPKEQQ